MIRDKMIARMKNKDFSLVNFLVKRMTVIVFIVLIIIMAFLNKEFLTFGNFSNILRQASVIGVLSLGMSFTMIHGSFDLSSGSVVSMSSVTVIVLIGSGVNPGLAVVMTLIVGMLAGAVNGVLIGLMRANSMICTFGTQVVFQGFALMITQGKYATAELSEGFEFIGKGVIFGWLPMPVLLLIVLAIIMQVIISRTNFGRTLYAIGINGNAARMNGINVRIYRLIVYTILGLFASIGGLIIASRVGRSSHFSGQGMEFDAVMSCVLGGASIYGGLGNALSGLFGAIVLATIANAQTLLGIPSSVQLMVKGLILAIIIGLDANSNRRKK